MWSIPVEALIDQPAADLTLYLYSLDQSIDIYLHSAGGDIDIGGGSLGSQAISSLPIPLDDQQFVESVLGVLTDRLSADFVLSGDRNGTDIDVYYDQSIDLGDQTGVILGVALPNFTESEAWWELLLAEPAFQGDQSYLRYAFLHELGHALGLEHPFEDRDGDTVNGITDPALSVYPEDTVMAYRLPLEGVWPQAYSVNDWAALEQIWGVRALEQPPVAEPQPVVQLGYRLLAEDSSQELAQLAVLGDSVILDAVYTLELQASTLFEGLTLESADIVLRFDATLFRDVQASDVRIGQALPVANAVQIDNALGQIRIAAAALADLSGGASAGLGSAVGLEPAVLASVDLRFDADYLAAIPQAPDGGLSRPALGFELALNDQETVLSRSFDDRSGQLNREILSLAELGGGLSVDGQDVTLYEARINLEQQGDGMVLGTQRVIGADASFTNLVRSQDVLQATSEWLNVGNITANNVRVTTATNANAALVDYQVVDQELASGSFVNGAFVEDGRESTEITASIRILGEAGQVVNLSDGLFFVEADGSDWFHNSGKGSTNLITYQGDLNYDGRVSMKDLAYLNAGAARQVLDGTGAKATAESYARDVDADFSGKIDLADLAVLDADWGKSLHTGDQGFLGSAELSWGELDLQGTSGELSLSWDNSSFKDQNAVEAAADYVGSLQKPGAVGVIGADAVGGLEDSANGGAYLQEPASS